MDADRLIRRLVYGVGTRLIASWGEPALGGVYKLVAVHHENTWLPAIKISDSVDKTPNPGNKRVWRVYDARGKATADLIGLYDELPEKESSLTLRHPADHSKYRQLAASEISKMESLLAEVLNEGKQVSPRPTIDEMRKTREMDVERLDPGVRRIMFPHIYHVSLTQKLWDLKQNLIRSARREL